MSTPLLTESDKIFWHRYTEFYEPEFSSIGEVRDILEVGLLKGNSIRWLLSRFPESRVVGGDILDRQPEWPDSERVEYFKVDQDSKQSIQGLFDSLNRKFDIVIDDGSHLSQHQMNCLVAGLAHVRSGGLYVVEDIHTSHPENSWCGGRFGALHILLALEHCKHLDNSVDEIRKIVTELATPKDLEMILEKCDRIRIYKRATLPHRCYNCGSSSYDYYSLKCGCGVDVYSNHDSMTAVIRVK